MIYKQVRLGNYSKSPAEGMISFLQGAISNPMMNPQDAYIATKHLAMMLKMDDYIAKAQCFDLSKIQHIVCPEVRDSNVFKAEVFPPYENLWLEDHIRTIAGNDGKMDAGIDTVWFTLYVKNGFPTDVDFLESIRKDHVKRGDIISNIPADAKVDNYTVFMGAKSKTTGVQFPYCMATWFSVNNIFFQSSNGVLFFVPTSVVFGDVPKDNFSSDAAVLTRFCRFLEIKNVRVGTCKIPLTTREFKHLKRGSQILHRVLMITKPGKQYESTGIECPVGAGRPLHMCRGHVREYTEKSPLFGKYSGRFFIHEHLRGDPDNGMIEKEYSIRGKND